MFEVAIEPLCYEAAFSCEALENPAVGLDELADVSVEASETFRTIAIALLLARGNTDAFYHNLIRSALARMAFLSRATREGRLDHPDAGCGRLDPLLDAMAAGDFQTAQRVLAHSRQAFSAGAEYEDDWCYARILGWLLDPSAATGPADRLLDQMLAFLEGVPNGRWAVCRALVDRDQGGFDAGIEQLLSERRAEIAESEAAGQIEDVAVMARRHIFVEGLAILRLAAARGLESKPDYFGCPSIARIPMVKAFPGE